MEGGDVDLMHDAIAATLSTEGVRRQRRVRRVRWAWCLGGWERVGARGAMGVIDETAVVGGICLQVGGKREGRCGV